MLAFELVSSLLLPRLALSPFSQPRLVRVLSFRLRLELAVPAEALPYALLHVHP